MTEMSEGDTEQSNPDVYEPEPKDPDDMEPLPFDYEYQHPSTKRADNIHEQRAIELGRREEWSQAYDHADSIFNEHRMLALRDKLSVFKNGSQRSVESEGENDD
jgi:hypothetical protein